MQAKDKLVISLVQTDIVWENPEKNIDHLNDLLQPLYNSVDIIILPEMFTTGFTMNVEKSAENMDDRCVKWMLEKSNETGSAICGSLVIKEASNTYNRFVFAEPNGDISYDDKRHLFSIGGEDKRYTPGAKRVIIEYKGWRIAPFICYDLRFPVWSRNRNDFDLMIYVANWPSPRKEVWKTLLKARAIENQSYVAGTNRVGKDYTNINYTGNSGIIDPKGNFISSSEIENESIITNTVSKNYLNEFREKFPISKDADDFFIKK
jgi:predicted amidohydrolase